MIPSPILASSLVTGSIGTRATEFRHRLFMQAGAVDRKAGEYDAGNGWRRLQCLDCGRDRDPRRTIGRKTIDTGGNSRKGNRGEPAGLAKFDRAPITRRQRFVLALAPAVPDRADGMNHMPGRKPIAIGDLGAAGFAAMERAAFDEKLGAGRAMDRTIHRHRRRGATYLAALTMASTLSVVDVGDEDFQPRCADLARDKTQAEAAAATVTPLSANSCCSSPAWNISRMMSQPPTNSPLT